MNSTALTNLNWGDKRKKTARYETIISQYSKHFGKPVPSDKQYWTLCSSCADENGGLLDGCELSQAVKAELIVPSQFHGVEHDHDIHTSNTRIKTEAHFYHNDFYTEMLSACQNGTFNPAVVNVDTLFMPARGIVMFSRIMMLISCYSPTTDNVLLVGNFILKNPYSGSVVSPNDITKELQKEPAFKVSMERCPWQFDNVAYIYNGTGKLHRCMMGSVVFYLKR